MTWYPCWSAQLREHSVVTPSLLPSQTSTSPNTGTGEHAHHVAQLTLPALDPPPSMHPFNDTFASQDGTVAVWDVRSPKSKKVFTSEQTRAAAMATWGERKMDDAEIQGAWLGSKDRQFSSGIGGKEVMTFTEVRHH
ncbi:hypothetical protein BJV74DRAFT_210300 [Russula compacta]|nr:hypothetical protein BJV74DRAFT_210300 [Russula compacta]